MNPEMLVIIKLAYHADIAGHVRRATDEDDDDLSQTLQGIFSSFILVAEQVQVALLHTVFKHPILPALRIRLKFA